MKRDWAKLAQAAGFWCGDDPEAGHTLLAAYDGDPERLRERLRRNPRGLSDEEYEFLHADSGREIKKPTHRPAKLAAAGWRNAVALCTVMHGLRTGDLDKVVLGRAKDRFHEKADTIGYWVQAFRNDDAKMAFARALIEHEKELIAGVTKLAKTDPDGSWDRPVISIIPAAVPPKSRS